jgi:hypothetical protein
MLAYDFPLLGLFWTMLLFFLFVAWVLLVFRIVVDIFRSHEIGGFGKAFWLIFVIVIPWLGVLAYVLVHGQGMTRRAIEDQRAQQAAFESYVRNTAGVNGTASGLSKLAELRDRGVISEAEFADQKARLLA